MAEYDKAGRYQVKQDPSGVFAWLWRRHNTPLAFHAWLDARRLALPVEGDLTCDLVAAFRLPDGQEPTHALIVELKSESERGTLLQLQGYIYRLCAERPADLAGIVPRVGGIIINLSGPPQERLVLASFPGLPECDWQFGVMQVNLREEDAAATLADILAGRTTRWILPWIPLMHGGDEPAIMEGWKQAALAEPDERVRATLAAFALVFAERANRREAWKQALEGWNMQKSQIVEEWREEARIETRQEDLLDLLEVRFGMVPEDLRQRIKTMTDMARLKAAHRQAASIQSLDDLQL